MKAKKKKKNNWLLPVALITGFGALVIAAITPAGQKTIKTIKDTVTEKLNIGDFVKRFLADAQLSEKQTGVPALVTLAQAALESGWGKSAPGNNFFGVKADKSWTGQRQLLKTTEILPEGRKFPEIVSIEPTGKNNKAGQPLFKYTIRDYFRMYNTPAQSFSDRGFFFKKNSRYASAFDNKDPYKFATAIAKAGYATDPDYEKKLHKLIYDFQNLIG